MAEIGHPASLLDSARIGKRSTIGLRAYRWPMVPLAVSGPIVVGVAVFGAIVLLIVLFRSEDREDHDGD